MVRRGHIDPRSNQEDNWLSDTGQTASQTCTYHCTSVTVTLRYYLNKIRQDGLKAIIKRRLAWYGSLIRYNNYWIGRAIELFGNRIRLNGMWFSLDTPAITTRDRCTIALGGHEGPERRFVRHMPRELPVIEFGGAIGVTSCVVNRHVKDPARHIVFEPNPATRALLEKNRDMNRCRFAIREAALGYGNGTVTFGIHPDMFMCKLSELGECATDITVPAVTVESVLKSQGWAECSLVTDIEGAETLLIEHEIDTLRAHCPFLMLEIHPNVLGKARCDEIVQLLKGAGFRVVESIGRNWAFRREDGDRRQ